ncbi:MAG: hypothetical protein V1767_00945 [Chloroflexota bacterium]
MTMPRDGIPFTQFVQNMDKSMGILNANLVALKTSVDVLSAQVKTTKSPTVVTTGVPLPGPQLSTLSQSETFLSLFNQSIHDKGVATGGSISTLTDSRKNWSMNVFCNSIIFMLIGGQVFIRVISSNNANSVSFDDLSPNMQAIAGVPYVIQHVELSPDDIHELAARLGSSDTYDRRGEVVWQCGFEDSLGFVPLALPAGATLTRSTLQQRNGSVSCRFLTNNVPGNAVGMSKFLQILPKGNMSFEVSFTISGGPTYSFAFARSVQIVGAYLNVGIVRLLLSGADVLVQVLVNNVYVTIDTVQIVATDSFFHTMKLVLNFDTGKYLRLMLDNKQYDLTNYNIGLGASLYGFPYIIAQIMVTSVGVIENAFFDDAIICQNEPGNSI